MSNEHVKKFLDAVCCVEKINEGGCLLTCYAFYKYSRANNIPLDNFGIVQYSHSLYSIEMNIEYLNNRAKTPVSSAHFTFIFDGKEYDGLGEITVQRKDLGILLSSYKRVTLPLNGRVQEFCVNALNDLYQWNSEFKRRKCIPVIEENLGINLEEITR